MKYTVEIEINLPRERVIELFDSTENLYKWQEGLQSFEHISGEPGQVGAQSRLLFKMGKREIEMVETITKRDLPDEFNGTYDAKGVHNSVNNRFIELDPGRTKWICDVEFQFKGFMKIVAWLMKGAFPKQSQKSMRAFKAFAEDGTDVREQA